MKKCTYCGLENPDEAVQCGTCHTSLDTSTEALTPLDLKPLKKFLPYLLSYIIITSGIFLYNHIKGQQTGNNFPPHYLILNTSVPADELVAKLEQSGVPKEAIQGSFTASPSLGWTLAQFFGRYAVYFFAFIGLIKLFQKIFRK